jgi:holo-[acyl-carrier protein] synthase
MICGIGCDIVRVDRIQRMLDSNPRFFDKVFTANEIAYCQAKASPAQSFAARFAAKEAFLKALGTGWSDGVSWQEIEVENDGRGKPILAVSGKTEELLRSKQAVGIHLALSHERDHALAFVTLEKLDA